MQPATFSFDRLLLVLGPDSGLEHVSQSTFPLPNLGVKLEEISRTLHTGRGFVVLRGLDPSRYTAWENAIVYLGVTSHIAEKRGCQDRFGNMLGKIRRLSLKGRRYMLNGSH